MTLIEQPEQDDHHMEEDDEADREEKRDSDPGRESNEEESESSNSSKSSQEPPDEDDKIGWQVFENLLSKKVKLRDKNKKKNKVRFNVKAATGPYRTKDNYNQPIQSITGGLYETHQFQYPNHQTLLEKEKKKKFLPPEELQKRTKGYKRNRNLITPDEQATPSPEPRSPTLSSADEESVDISISESEHSHNNHNDPNRSA